jgi:GT2 family glycosyltransferase
MNKIDIVIPVYNGLEYLPKLFESIFENTDLPSRLIIIDDASPDKKVWEFLSKVKSENPDKEIVLLRNETNLGFVKTVNRAVKMVQNHFVLLNTDVEVPKGWLSRLMRPILNLEKVASATPFTNSGTIFSFPEFTKDNEIFEGLGLAELDKYFQMVNTRNNFIEMPTGVGFCMAFNKNVVDEIGMFDEKSFGRGYCEENDWCQRAIKKGYKNVIAPNLFVYHKHGGSFPSEEKEKLIKENFKKLLEKHPRYSRDVEKFIQNDPLKNIRDFLILLISSNFQSDNRAILFIDHELGGGANFYREKYIRKCLKEGKKMLLLGYDTRKIEYHARYYYKQYKIGYKTDNLNEARKLFELAGIDKIILSQIVSYENPLYFLELIKDLKKNKQCGLEILVHDYYSVCQIFVLLDWENKYCNVPDFQKCNECLSKKKGENSKYIQIKDQELWREAWRNFIEEADEIIFFSSASKEIVKKAYEDLPEEKMRVVPHSVDNFKKTAGAKNKSKNHPLTIGILGGINFVKGSGIIKEMVEIIEKEKLDVKIVVIGSFIGNIKSAKLKVLGKYDREDVPVLAAENEIDVFFIPSIWPETFSYTSQEIMNMRYPLAVFNLGAPAERAARYDKGLIIPKINPKIALDLIVKFYKGTYQAMPS